MMKALVCLLIPILTIPLQTIRAQGAASSATGQTNLVEDAGFETDGQGPWLNHWFGPQFSTDWDATDQKHGGTRSLKLMATGQTDAENRWEMCGARLIFPVRPGDIISGGGWLKWDGLKDVEVFIECKWLDEVQQEIKKSSTQILGIGTEHKTSGSGDWQYQDLATWSVAERTAPAEAKYVDFRLVLLAAGTADKATGTAWWDDVEFTIQKKQ
jgi:hypothetical protein